LDENVATDLFPNMSKTSPRHRRTTRTQRLLRYITQRATAAQIMCTVASSISVSLRNLGREEDCEYKNIGKFDDTWETGRRPKKTVDRFENRIAYSKRTIIKSYLYKKKNKHRNYSPVFVRRRLNVSHGRVSHNCSRFLINRLRPATRVNWKNKTRTSVDIFQSYRSPSRAVEIPWVVPTVRPTVTRGLVFQYNTDAGK